MVLESITNPFQAEAHPRMLAIHGFVFATLGLFLGLWIFESQASLIMVFLTTMAVIPLVYSVIKIEEKKDLSNMQEKTLLQEHSKALNVFMFYFIGATVAFAFWYMVLPQRLISNAFVVQVETITHIRSSVTGNAYNAFGVFTQILSNNLKVLIFCVLFSFIYGLGAIFILTWNASVIGVAIGQTIKKGLAAIAGSSGIVAGLQTSQVVLCGLFRYSIHGIPEIGSYFIAGLSGGIISVAAIRHDFGTKQYEKIVMDASVLLLVALGVLVLSAWLEVYVTPLVFPNACVPG